MKARKYTKEIMDYFYEKDGWLYWKENRYNYKCKDCLAGHLNEKTLYYVTKINGKNHYNHRILYQIYNNIILEPTDVVDHINRIRTDNRKENLVKKTNAENSMNQKTNKNNLSTGIKNITIQKTKYNYNYYHVQISGYGKKFSKFFRTDKCTLEEVIEIRNKKLIELHGDSACFD